MNRRTLARGQYLLGILHPGRLRGGNFLLRLASPFLQLELDGACPPGSNGQDSTSQRSLLTHVPHDKHHITPDLGALAHIARVGSPVFWDSFSHVTCVPCLKPVSIH